MAIASTDILYKLSTTSGSAGNTTAGTPAGSLGKYVSTTTVSSTAANNIFDDVTGAENAASDVEYRCVFVLNNHASLTLTSAVVYMTSDIAGGTSVALGADTTAASAKGSSSAQALQVADENTAPSGVTFVTTPISDATGLSLGDIPAGSVKAFWIRRTAANTTAVNSDGFTLNVAGDTTA